MNELTEERLFDLLTQQAVEGLNAAETNELRELENAFPMWKDDDSFELATTAFSLTNLDTSEDLPQHLQNKILADSERLLISEPVEETQKTFTLTPNRSNWSWLGWAFASVACIALAFNWSTTNVNAPPQNPVIEALNASQLRQRLIDTDKNALQINWSKGNMKDLTEISGDLVWSDIKQSGYMRFKGLPINDRSKESYQLWIFDETQDEKTPIDGGVFDVNSGGEIIVPITAKLKVKNPKLFAVTVEKPGGVVVSKREKIPVLAKIST
jgi:anti-sigma-K factor RskA